ncbi:alpha-L-glutamate ligase [Limibacillus sp. MBR-115]|jgi:glutathione synthase/RimK-type ligase-like ATP-grasp enzyme|uniref:ATP-grasp domain-containing protein n=1 Tax=Limibacillus sp. MBR-115 TaxID=3156465 RepID=UPI003393692A
MSKIYILHENDEWLPPFRSALESAGLDFEEWHLDEGILSFDSHPPEGIFYSRMSASAHTRGHTHAPSYTQHVLNWLELNGRRVVNGSRALYLEVSKVAQYAALQAAGVRTPRTRIAVGKDAVLPAARAFAELPLILKPNRGGKGLGVQLFQDLDSLATYLESPEYEAPVDGTWLIQQYIRPAEPYITRAEFIGGRFHYAVRVDTSQGFELCPADACAVGDAFCPATPDQEEAPKFQITDDIDPALISTLEKVLADNGVEVAGIEFIRDIEGNIYTYDINTNTNYNNGAERSAKLAKTGPQKLAEFLGEELQRRAAQAIAAE